ncbi:hypothetical protein JOF36_006858 [Pseudonocardia parietis]|uniref:Uncharacterized protein n=1 Tax=Pseudonocardia parietis TaxID=570936 RepID=A0ABS4W4L6_9PSEU|nr:hypothetical protein [Pseudonocardia parietis]
MAKPDRHGQPRLEDTSRGRRRLCWAGRLAFVIIWLVAGLYRL